MSAIELKAYEVLKNKLDEDEATTLIEYFENKAEEKYAQRKDVFATKEDIALSESRIAQKNYTANIIQFIATVASVLAILKFMIV